MRVNPTAGAPRKLPRWTRPGSRSSSPSASSGPSWSGWAPACGR